MSAGRPLVVVAAWIALRHAARLRGVGSSIFSLPPAVILAYEVGDRDLASASPTPHASRVRGWSFHAAGDAVSEFDTAAHKGLRQANPLREPDRRHPHRIVAVAPNPAGATSSNRCHVLENRHDLR